MNILAEKIARYLLEGEYFENFSLRKRDSSLINKLPYGAEIIQLQHWIETNHDSGKQFLIVRPLYLKRFNILHKWFEKYSVKSISDQRDSYSVGFNGNMLNTKNEFLFNVDEVNNPLFDIFRDEVIKISADVFSKFSSIECLYNEIVQPCMLGEHSFPDVGAEWAFEYLLITKIVDNENYERNKGKILSRIEELNSRGEPNIQIYYDKVDEIVAYLENQAE